MECPKVQDEKMMDIDLDLMESSMVQRYFVIYLTRTGLTKGLIVEMKNIFKFFYLFMGCLSHSHFKN